MPGQVVVERPREREPGDAQALAAEVGREQLRVRCAGQVELAPIGGSPKRRRSCVRSSTTHRVSVSFVER